MSQRCVVSLSILVGLAIVGCSRPSNEYIAPPPPAVTTASPVQQPLTLFIENNGETQAFESAEVSARVRGFIEELMFEPGQIVKQGDPLYRIESDQYEAERLSAQASVEAAKAAISVATAAKQGVESEVTRAENELQRAKKLIDQNAGSQSEYDQALATRDAAVAQLRSSDASIEAAGAELSRAKATLANAELNLSYTTVSAPIAGRITRTTIDRGNLVENGSQLATIVNRAHIFVYFNISDRTLLDLTATRPREQRSGPLDWSKIPVYLNYDQQGKDWLQGQLNYVDQAGIDQSTGTFSLRAKFENSNDLLMPGMFVSVRLPVKQVADAILVPQKAITRSQQGDYLFVVDSSNVVEQRTVELGQSFDGWVLVADGLRADESFVIDGIQRVRAGEKVSPTSIELSTEDSPMLQAAIMGAAAGEPDQQPESQENAKDQANRATDTKPEPEVSSKPQ